MAETISVSVGGEEIALPLILNFATLKRAWPAIQARELAGDSVGQAAASLAVIAAILIESRPELTLPELEKRLRVARFDPATGAPVAEDERRGVVLGIDELLICSGLVRRTGEPDAGNEGPPATGVPSPSTAIGTISSPS